MPRRPIKPPRIPAKVITETIKARVGKLDRSVFDEQIARALTCGPGEAHWRKKSKADPEGWSRALLNLARMRGLAAERKEVITYTPKLAEVAEELRRRFGEDQARVLLKAVGADAELPNEAIEGETVK